MQRPGNYDQGTVYVRSRFLPESPAQRLAPKGSGPSFGSALAFNSGILVVKADAKTYFFRKEAGTWIEDGMITGQTPFATSAGPLVAGSSFLLSGMEIYSWPAREYLQTLQPPGYTGSYIAVDAAGLGGPLVISYGNETVWNFLPAETGFDPVGHEIMPPTGTDSSGFGASIALIPPNGMFLLVGAPRDDENGENTGAVHLYMGGEPGHWDYIQKITPPVPMAGEQFGSAIAADNERVYISAPYRNENRQNAGAIFIFERPDLPPPAVPVRREFKEKVVLKDTVDMARLGATIATHNRIIYASHADTVVALHPPITLRPILGNTSLFIEVGTPELQATLDSSTDLSMGWSQDPTAIGRWGFQVPFDTTIPARLFRVRLKTAF
jgi:hypothetical protein